MLLPRQAAHVAQVWRHPQRQARRQHGLSYRDGFLLAAQDRQGESAGAIGRHIAPLEQGQQGRLRCRLITGNGIAERHAPLDFGIGFKRQRHAIAFARPFVLAHQVIGQPVFGGIGIQRLACCCRTVKQHQRLGRVIALQGYQRGCRQNATILSGNPAGAFDEAFSGIDIVEIKRGARRFQQVGQRNRIARQPPQGLGQPPCRWIGQGLDHFLR